MSDNPFVLPTTTYQRDVKPAVQYFEDAANYLANMTGQPIEVCQEHLKKVLGPGGKFEISNPTVTYLERQLNGDRAAKQQGLKEYLNESLADNEIIAPTFTTYVSPNVHKSLFTGFVNNNIKLRNKYKGLQFKAKANGDKTAERFNKSAQTNRKRSNNALSGAQASPFTPMHNKSAHSTLTSTCRTTSGYGNANNEKIIAGNRHYWSYEIAINNIVSIATHSDLNFITSVINEFNLKYPTVDDVVKCITHSTSLYWKSKIKTNRIRDYVSTLSEAQRAAVVYTGDLYHIRVINPDFFRDFIDQLALRVGTPHPDPEAVFKSCPEDYHHLAVQICVDDMTSFGAKGESIALNNVKGTPTYGIIASTTENIVNTINKYFNFIRAFLVTKNIPSSVAAFPNSIRRSVLTSDTDSTIFTVQDWVLWHCGEMDYTSKGYAVAAVMIFLASQSITHVLAIMSANLGVVHEMLHQIKMKNEFKFDVFVPTQEGKHYFALIRSQEGNVVLEHDVEVKGVHLKSSNVPVEIMAKAKELMISIMHQVLSGKKLSMLQILTTVANVERDIIKSISLGESTYFRRTQVKPLDSYKNKEFNSTYQQYLFWDTVFGEKYGAAPPPPYGAVKISTNLDKPREFNAWLDRIEDKVIVDKLVKWVNDNNRKCLGSLMLVPTQSIANGIPVEIMNAIDVRNIVGDTANVFYIILEALGYYVLNKNKTKLISDHY